MVDTTTPINPVNPINTITPTNPKIPTDQSVCNPLVKISSAIWSPNMEFVVDEVGDFVYSADDFVYDDGLEYDGRKSETDYSETKLYRDICFAFRYDNCDNLDLSDRKIHKIGLRSFSGIENLDLSKNNLETIEFLDLPKLTFLNLSHNQFESIPQTVLNLSQLEILNISHPKELNLDRCDLFSSSLALKELYLQNCKLKTVPESVTRIKTLKVLDLSNNEIVELPENLNNVKSLTDLYLQSNKIVNFIDCSSLKLEILDLSNNQIEILPKTFGKVETLRGLNLKNNRLREFPPCEHLKNLQVLDISNDKREENNNHIEKLPFSICNLIGLKALLMSKALYMNSDTRFDTEGTPGFSQLINLEVLDCSGNELEFVDKLKVDSCPNLKQINFSDNKITMLFLPVVQRQTLTHVIFSGNKELNRCAFFPHSTGLEYLDFSGCSIKNLSTVAGKQAKKVKQIFLHDNQLKHDKDTSKLVDSSDQKSMNKMRQKFPNAKIWTIKATNKNLDDGLEEMYRSFYSNITVTREIVGKKGETETIFTSLHKLESQKKED